MSKTPEERISLLEKLVKKQRVRIDDQAAEIEKVQTTLRRVADRTDKLRLAVPHIQFEGW